MNDAFILTGKRYHHYRFDRDIRAQLSRLRADNWHALVALAEDYVIIGLSIAACYTVSWWFYPLAVLIIGARQRGLSTILHDTAHRVGATNRKLNMLLGTIFTAYPIFQQHYAYQASHVYAHHPYLGNPEKDPDFQFFIRQEAYSKMSPKRCFIKFMVLPLSGIRTLAYLKYLIDNRLKNIRQSKSSKDQHNESRSKQQRRLQQRWDSLAFILFWTSVAALGWWFGVLTQIVLFWLLPYLTAFQILGWYIELSEHTPLMASQDTNLYLTRNRKSQGLEKFLTGIHNDHHHLDHHLDTRIPFWHLPEANRIRCQDPNYRRVDQQMGGLFTRGPNGAPSAMSAVYTSMTQNDQPPTATTKPLPAGSQR